MSGSKDLYRFGKYELRVRSRTVSYQGTPVPLESKTFEVLLCMVANAGRVVTKDELLKTVWPDSFVEESNLTQHVFRLRKALQAREDGVYIVTVPGQGYQFSPEVESAAPPVTMEPEPAEAQEEHRPPAVPAQARRWGWGWRAGWRAGWRVGWRAGWRGKTAVSVLAFAMTLAALGIWGWRATGRRSPAARVGAARRSIAVLGFRNLSGRPEEGWLSTALAEMLSTELVAGDKLRLVSGEEITRTKLDLHLVEVDSLSRNTLARVHKDLDSDLIVLGSYTALVGQPDTRIRLDVRLQDTAAGETIADIAVVGSEANLFDLVSQAGAELREKLGVEAVSPVEAVSVRASLPSNRDAARLYSEGLARLRVFDALAARGLLEGSIAADPKYSLAHSALAEAWSRLGYDKKAQAEARQAFELAANLSREERFVVEGRYRDIDHEYDKAIEIYRSLFVLFPDNLDYGLKLAAVQVRAGKGHDALATVESLRNLMPPASELPLIDWQEAAAWEALGDIKQQEQPLARAVELARAQGSRLILARARQEQCWVFSHLEQLQDAVAACRESRDIYASAGDGYGEANSLTLWADATSEADAPEAIRLYQEAEVIERKVGSEVGVATVLNNLGIVYGAQGDLAAAEKMYRQSLESFRLLGSKVNELKVTGNVADQRREQGDLPGAIQLYQAALQLDKETDTGSANMIGFDLAVVHQLQGDLGGAKQEMKQALQFWQKNGDRSSQAEALSGLGSVLLEEADFSGARKMYEQALAIRKSGGDQLTIAETQLGLAGLSLEEAHSPAEQEASARQVIEVFQKQKARDDEIQAWCILARALLVQGKAAAAADASGHALSLAGKSQAPETRWRTAIAAARVNSTGPAARKELDAVVAKSRELGYRGVELDARLALAEIEIRAGQPAAGRAHLAAIEADAKSKGYNLIARKASILAHG